MVLFSTCSLTTIVALVVLFTLGGASKQTVARDITLAGQAHQVHILPHEMAASQLKATLIDDIKIAMVGPQSESFYLEYSSFSPKLLACLLMAAKEHAKARTFLASTASLSLEQLQQLRDHQATAQVMKSLELLEGQKISIVGDQLLGLIAALDVQPLNQHAYKRAGYATYYADKKEDFSLEKQTDWNAKQKNVYNILQEFKPQTVLDIGGNSGWFSRLAATYGAQVIATDIDEQCTEFQFNEAQHTALPVFPMIYDFKNFLQKADTTRFQSDAVFCLALVHHLVFVAGLTLEEIIDTLAKLTKRVLVLEFVDLQDKTIQSAIKNQDAVKGKVFFEDKKKHTTALEILQSYGYANYSLEKCKLGLEKHFTSVTAIGSHPSATRSLLVCVK